MAGWFTKTIQNDSIHQFLWMYRSHQLTLFTIITQIANIMKNTSITVTFLTNILSNDYNTKNDEQYAPILCSNMLMDCSQEPKFPDLSRGLVWCACSDMFCKCHIDVFAVCRSILICNDMYIIVYIYIYVYIMYILSTYVNMMIHDDSCRFEMQCTLRVWASEWVQQI